MGTGMERERRYKEGEGKGWCDLVGKLFHIALMDMDVFDGKIVDTAERSDTV